ncbi:hypothetical protein VNO77_06491 [Canavalia gladiata]|uniref:Uncharacterized protein n=1 Tax=Canavalia gladiata TaxID=3824 RepID=A0AAN9R030_CANGL
MGGIGKTTIAKALFAKCFAQYDTACFLENGTDEVEGITLDLSQIVDLHLSADTFNRMPNLRFLQLYVPTSKISRVVYLHRTDLEAFSDELRYLEWNGFPFKSLPPTFCAKFLVQIYMPHSHVEELWQGTQDLANLERIVLSQCRQLMKLPDFSRASRLKWLDLSYCVSLCDLHPSILSLDTLDTLILYWCIKLKSIKSEKNLRSLNYVGIYACRSLEEFSLSSDLITYLDLSLTRSEILHLSIRGLRNLRKLYLDGSRVKNLPDELSCLTSLEELRVSNSTQVINKPKLHVLFDGLRSLRTLYLENCSSLCELPDNISLLSSLHELRLNGTSVESLPADIKHLQVLEILSLKNCSKLQCLPELPQSILQLHADNCTSLTTVSTLRTFAAHMKREDLHISFKNCTKLDVHSLNCIMEDAHLGMIGSACHYVLLGGISHQSVRVCLPGSRVPTQFTSRTTESSISIKLTSCPNVLGYFFSVVLFCPLHTKINEMGEIFCQLYLGDSTTAKVLIRRSRYEINLDLSSDHVFVWYDTFPLGRIFGKGPVSFEFGVFTDTAKHDGLIIMKECGVHPLCVSELDSFPGYNKLCSELEASKLKSEFRRNASLMVMGKRFNSKEFIFRTPRQTGIRKYTT